MQGTIKRIQSEAEAGNCSTIIGLCTELLMHQPELTIKEKNVYGKILVYPACDKSNIFAGLVGAKTFTMHHLHLIEGLGYKINLIKLP